MKKLCLNSTDDFSAIFLKNKKTKKIHKHSNSLNYSHLRDAVSTIIHNINYTLNYFYYFQSSGKKLYKVRQ